MMTPTKDSECLILESRNSKSPQYSFTPRVATKTKANHAWDRKPATPFAARNENQKIWKRYDLPGDHAQKPEIRRSQDNRSVKKMKVHDGEDAALTTKWDETTEDDGRMHKRITRTLKDTKAPTFTIYGNEATEIATSPVDEAEIVYEALVAIDTLDHPEVANKLISLHAGTPMKPSAPHTTETMSEAQEQTNMHSVNTIPEVEQFDDEASHEIPTLPDTKDVETSFKTLLQLQDFDLLSKSPGRTIPAQLGTEEHVHIGTSAGFTNLDQVDESTLDIEQQHVPTPQSPSNDTQLDVLSINQEIESEEARCHRIIPEIPSPASAQDSRSEHSDSISPRPFEQSGAFHAIETHTSDPVDDDTQLLQSFLSRAKARKAAATMEGLTYSPKKRTSPSKSITDASPMTRSRAALVAANEEAISPMMTESSFTSSSNIGKESTQSPIRRSKRRTSARTPKSQSSLKSSEPQPTAPNQIPVLRRPNGSEFVFLARTEAQEIALATRNNTRRNKGQAIEPKARLKGFEEPVATGSRSPSPKKKKVSRQEGKTAKQVAWDEQLAYFEAEKEKAKVAAAKEMEVEEKASKKRGIGAAKREKTETTQSKVEEGKKGPAAGTTRRAKRLTNGTPISRKLLADPMDSIPAVTPMKSLLPTASTRASTSKRKTVKS